MEGEPRDGALEIPASWIITSHRNDLATTCPVHAAQCLVDKIATYYAEASTIYFLLRYQLVCYTCKDHLGWCYALIPVRNRRE